MIDQPKCTCITTGSAACKYPHPCRQCCSYHPGVSCYWRAHGKTPADKRSDGRTFPLSDGRLGCNECCTGDRCDDRSHHSRDNCPYCLGSNLIPESEVLIAQRELESRSMSTWSAEELALYSKITGQEEKTLDAALVKLAAILGGSFGDGHHSDTEMVLEAVRRLEVA